jgi:hypothetical protein
LRLPYGTTARVRPYKSQNVFLKNYIYCHQKTLVCAINDVPSVKLIITV